jgi:alpha-galactosidase
MELARGWECGYPYRVARVTVSTVPAFGEVVAELEVDPLRCLIHAEGWQSWTPTTAYRMTDEQWLPVRPEVWTWGYGGSRPRPSRRAGAFQGDGLLVVDPGSGEEVVAVGARAADQAIPVVRCELVGRRRLVVTADAPVSIIGMDASGGIDAAKVAFADAFAGASGVSAVRSAPTIWCSWYDYFSGITEADVDESLRAIADRELPVDVIQLDDGYERELGDWLELSSGFTSLARTVDRIREHGRRAGIWLAPFLVGVRSAVAAEHPEWIVRGENRAPVFAIHNWGQDPFVLDVTHPGARDHLKMVLRSFVDMGFDFFKLDFLFAAALNGRRFDRSLTGTEAYRQGLAHIRSAVGEDAYVLGCGAPLLPSVGMVDAMRISADTSPRWASVDGDMSFPGGEAAELSVHGRAYQHGRYWVNDPDCLLLGPGVEQRERRVKMMREHDGLRGISGRLTNLDEWATSTARELLMTRPPPTPSR